MQLFISVRGCHSWFCECWHWSLVKIGVMFFSCVSMSICMQIKAFLFDSSSWILGWLWRTWNSTSPKNFRKKKKSTENLQARVSFELKCEDMGIFLIYSTSVKYPCLSFSSRLGCAKQKTSFFSACHTNEIMQSSRQISACLLEYGENASLLSCK